MHWEYDKTNFDRNLAVVIGIDHYKSDSIHDLSTPVSDARALADLLETEYEYKPENVVRLFDSAATLTGLQTLLTDTLPNQLKPTKYDRLIFYFAGHGIPRNSKDGPEGYLVPQDADWQKDGSFLAMSEVYKELSKLECHHLLVILDCCFAGTFRWAGRRKMIPILETVRREHYDRFIRYPAWQVITSAAHDQEALDVAKLAEDKRGAVVDEKQQELHSPFALALLEGLRENKADIIPDGVITAHELYLYLDQQVSQLSGSRQKPGIYPMRLEYDRGEFVFTKPGFTSEQLKPAPLLNESNNPYRGLASFDEKHAKFFFGRKILVEELQHRLSQANRSLTVVLGASGSGKSSLVKAGLIPELRQESKWYILDPIRPDRSPFTALARAILPIAQPELIEQLSQVSFLDEVFKPKEESGQDKGDESTDAVFVKLAESWNSATSEAKLLIVDDYFEQLLAFSSKLQEEKEQLSQLNRAILEQLESLSNRLQNEPQHLTSVIRKWSETHPNAKLLLIIDQFEELITMSQENQTETHGSDRQESNSRNETIGDRAAEPQPWLPFLQVLRGVIVEGSQQLHIVLTLRSDFEPRFLSSPLSAYWRDARFPVRAMNLDELRQAIEGPALKQALYFEPPELVGKLIDEVGQMPGALPLLSFTLSELYAKLYERWKPGSTDRALRIKDYEELGGVAGALTRRATQEYDNLVRDFGKASGKAYQATMRRVMLRMVVIEGGGVARRRVPESELVYPDPEENKRVAQVSDRLIKARLLVKGQETGEPYVEPAHDFLVRGWDKLQGWIKEEQEDLTLQHRLTSAAHDWKHGRGMLWIEEVDRLAKLEKVIESETDNWLNKLETKFVTGSIRERQDRIKKLEEDLRISEQRRARAEVREKATRVEKLVNREPLDALILTIQAIGQNLQELPGEFITSALTNLYTMTQYKKVTGRPFTFENGVDQVIFCSDNLHLGVIEYGGLVHLLDLQGTDVIQSFDVHYSLIFSISPNGQYIVKGTSSRSKDPNDDGKIWLSDLRGNSVVTSFSAHKDGMAFLEFSPDSQYIVSRGGDMTVRLWDIKGNFISEPFQMYNDDLISDSSFTQPENCGSRIISFAINPNSKSIVTASLDGIIQLYNLQGEPIRDPFPERIIGRVMRIVFSTDYTTIATISFIDTGNDTGLIEISSWDIEGKPINKYRLGLKDGIIFPGLNLLELSPDCKYVVLGYGNGTFELRDIESTLVHAVFKGHENSVRSVAFSPNGQMIASVSDDYTLRLWDIKGNSINQQFFDFEDQDKGEICFQTNQEKVQSLAISPDGQYIASGGYDNTVRLWDCKGNTLGKPCQVHESNPYSDPAIGIRRDGVRSVAISPDGQYIASGGYDNTIRLCNFKGDSLVEHFRDWKTTGGSIAFSPNGQLIAIVSGEAIHLCNIKGNPVLKPFRGEHEYLISMVAFSPDGQFFISIDLDGQVFFWNLKGEQIRQPFRAERLLHAVAFSPNSQYIVCGGLVGRVALWDLEGNLISCFERGSEELIENHSQKYIHSVAFSPDGQYIASGSQDGTICLSDLQGFLICPPFQGHSGKVNSVVFSPDGKYIFSGGEDGTIRRWNCWPIWLQTCCNRLQWHTVFKYPNEIKNLEQRQIAVDACKTCQNYIWNSDEVGANELYKKAVDIKARDIEAAIQIFNQIVRFNVEYGDAYFSRGLAYAELGNQWLARVDLQKAVNIYQRQGKIEKYQNALSVLNHFYSLIENGDYEFIDRNT